MRSADLLNGRTAMSLIDLTLFERDAGCATTFSAPIPTASAVAMDDAGETRGRASQGPGTQLVARRASSGKLRLVVTSALQILRRLRRLSEPYAGAARG